MQSSLPDLSVVLVTPAGLDHIRKTVRHLARQTAAERMELIVLGPSASALEGLEAEAMPLRLRIVEADPAPSVTGARVVGAQAATAPIVAFAEDHSFPEPGWAEALLAAFLPERAVVGPVVLNGNPRTLLSWANYFACFGHWSEGAPGGVDGQSPWHNSAYRRDLMLSFGEDLASLFSAEGLLQEAIKSQGHQVFITTDARTHHMNISMAGVYVRHAFLGGRLFSGRRSKHEGWSLGKRGLHLLASPLVPLVRFRRILGDAARCAQAHPPLWQVAPLLFLGLLCHALGEVTGLLLGEGGVERGYSHYELWRAPSVTPEDRKLLTVP